MFLLKAYDAFKTDLDHYLYYVLIYLLFYYFSFFSLLPVPHYSLKRMQIFVTPVFSLFLRRTPLAWWSAFPSSTRLLSPFLRRRRSPMLITRHVKELFLCTYRQGCGSAFIPSGSGSSILGWIRIRIQYGSGSRALMTKDWKKITAEKKI